MKRAIVATVLIAMAGCASYTNYEAKLQAKFIKDAYKVCLREGGNPSTQNTTTGNFVICREGRNTIFKAEVP